MRFLTLITIPFLCTAAVIQTFSENGLEITIRPDLLTKDEYRFDEAVWLSDFGEPDLPSVILTVGIPQGATADVRVLENQQSVMENVIVEPARPLAVYEEPAPKTISVLGPVYRRNEIFPKEAVSVSAPSYYRDLNTITITVHPVRCNPIKKQVSVSNKIRLSISFKGKPVIRAVPPDLFAPVYRTTVINYDQCKSWRREQERNGANPFSGHTWFKIEVTEEGLYKIGYDELRKAGLDPRQFDPNTMKIYTITYDDLPGNVHQPFADSLVSVPVFLSGADDGMFDKDDYLLFYGLPASHYTTDSALAWLENGFTYANVYWFTFGGEAGKRMAVTDATWDGSAPDSTANEIVHLEQDVGNIPRSGTNWYWKDISPGSGPTGGAEFNIQHPHASGAVRVTAAIFPLSSPGPFGYEMLLNDETICYDTIAVIGHDRWPPTYISGYGSIDGDSSLFAFNIIRLSGNTSNYSVLFNSLDIQYRRVAYLDSPFHSWLAAPGAYTMKCLDADPRPFVLDITDPFVPKIDSATVQGSTLLLSGTADSFQLLYFSKLSLTKPAVLIAAEPGRLREPDAGAEYLIITHRKFYNALMPLVEYHRRKYSTKIVMVDDIYNDFNYGKFDPFAIKHFLHYTTDNWTQYPTYVLLVGDATYDYKNNLQKENPPNYVPMIDTGTILVGNPGMPPNFIYEGEFVNFEGFEDMILGRITVRTTKEVRDFTDKMISYESKDIDGIWNKRVLCAGDDEWATNYGWEGPMHCQCCESMFVPVAESIYNHVKVYMVSYKPFNYDANTTKPNAQGDFIKEINRGALLGAYIGHGNTHQLSHQIIFYQQTDIPKINNGRRNGLYYFGSCTVGRFDDSNYECIGEEFVRIPDGAIGTIAASCGTSNYGNQAIGIRLFQMVTDPDTNWTMGQYFIDAKRFGDRHYLLIGDPATELRKVQRRMNLTATPDSVRPMELLKVTTGEPAYYISAFVRNGDTIPYFDETTINRIAGYVYRLVQSSPSTFVPFGYYIDGKEFYKGFWNTDTARFPAPRIVTNDLPVIKLSTYKNFLSGHRDSLPVYGSALPSTDQTGPAVTLYDGGRRLNDGDWVDSAFVLTGTVSDESGINLLNSKEDARGFYLYINQDVEEKIDLRNFFLYDQNSYTEGKFSTSILLPESVDTITVNVNDNNFNQTTLKVILNTEQFGGISLEDLLVYPNPVLDRKGLWFTFRLTASGTVKLRIFSIAGRLIKVIDPQPRGAGYNQIFWDGLDEYGEELSNGVYLVQVAAEAEGHQDEVTEKFIIAR
ncbi:MAG TPA: C25 family cysteine peptidase [bacterium]